MQHPSGASADELAALAAAWIDEPHGEDDELSSEDLGGEDLAAGVERLTSHVLRCRQGLGNAYVYDDSTFIPPATGQVWTRVAFFDARGARLLLTAWRDKGGGNPYRTIINRWIWRNPRVERSLVLWWQNGYSWSDWDDC